jgi:hypothetical protein
VQKNDNWQRLPPLSTALILETMRLEDDRDSKGVKWCLAHGIGARRQKLGPLPAENNSVVTRGLEMHRDNARVLLASLCEICPKTRCEMKEVTT